MTDDNHLSPDLIMETTHILQMCKVVPSARARTVEMLIAAEEWKQLIDLECNPRDYNDSTSYANACLVTKLIQKSPNVPLDKDTKQAAYDQFFVNELKCRDTNTNNPVLINQHNGLTKAAAITSQILGSYKHAIQVLPEKCGFGPGTVLGASRGFVLSDKLDKDIYLTPSLYPFARALMGDNWANIANFGDTGCRSNEVQSTLKLVDYDEWFCVPKNAKTDRGACKNPSLNSFVQTGIGKIIRNKLSQFGFSISHQTKNQEMASRAQRDGLATIDFSNASDNISWTFVKHMLPDGWFDLLELARCPKTKISNPDTGEEMIVTLEKFSAMGNGFTFELESLLFLAVALAYVPEHEWTDVSIYGDDLIIPAKYYNEVVEAFTLAGLEVNREKTFVVGSFFESCGEDYFNGINVRGYFLKGKSDNDGLPYPLQIANKLRLYAWKRGGYEYCDSTFFKPWMKLKSKCPKMWKSCIVPPDFGDAGLIGSYDEWMKDGKNRPLSRSSNRKFVESVSRFAPHLEKEVEELLNKGQQNTDWGVEIPIVTVKPVKICKRKRSAFLSSMLPRPVRRSTTLHRRDDGIDIGSATLGFEPRRGFLNQHKQSWTSITTWSKGLSWKVTSDFLASHFCDVEGKLELLSSIKTVEDIKNKILI